MQDVSELWKSTQRKTMVPLSFVEIDIGVGDPEAQLHAEVSDNGHEAFSDVQGVITETEKTPPKYATLEPNLWRLDGTFRILGERVIQDTCIYGVAGVGRVGAAKVNWRG